MIMKQLSKIGTIRPLNLMMSAKKTCGNWRKSAIFRMTLQMCADSSPKTMYTECSQTFTTPLQAKLQLIQSY